MFALVPILAQTATTLAVADRTEVRARFDKYSGTAEASTNPTGLVGLSNKRESLTLRYGPVLTLTTVGGTQDRALTVYHTAQLVGTLRLRRTTLTLSQTADYGTRSFIVDAFGDRGLANAPPPTGVPGATPGTGMPTPPNGTATGGTGTTGNGTIGNGTLNGAANGPTVAAQPGIFRYGDLITQATLGYALSKRSGTGVYFRYLVAGGLDDVSRESYPIIHNPSVGAYYGYQISERSGFTTGVQGSYSTSSNGIRTYNVDYNAGYRYRFTKSFAVTLGGGIGYAKILYPNGDVLEYIYLTAGTGAGIGFEYRTKLYGGVLMLYARFGYAPTLDQVRGVLDPRISWALGSTWTRNKVALYAGVTSTISVNVTETGSFDALNAAIGGSYRIGGGLIADAGVRGVWQAFEGTTTIPPSVAVFAGLTWGASTTF